MDTICATCAANGYCVFCGQSDVDEDYCDAMLERMVEKYRIDYRSSWFSYIKEFED